MALAYSTENPRYLKILAILEHAAMRGLPCPTNRDIAKEIKSGGEFVASAIQQMAGAGVIEIWGNAIVRKIGIFGTKYVTAPTKPTDQILAKREYSNGIIHLPESRYLQRDPCTYCGVRGDIGCRHNRRAAA